MMAATWLVGFEVHARFGRGAVRVAEAQLDGVLGGGDAQASRWLSHTQSRIIAAVGLSGSALPM